MNIFLQASRDKLRFDYKGQCSVEDLWDLSLRALDKIYGDLSMLANAEQAESLLRTRSVEDKEAALKMEIVEEVFNVKSAEANEAKNAIDAKAQREKLLGLLDAKRNAQLSELTEEELLAKIAEL